MLSTVVFFVEINTRRYAPFPTLRPDRVLVQVAVVGVCVGKWGGSPTTLGTSITGLREGLSSNSVSCRCARLSARQPPTTATVPGKALSFTMNQKLPTSITLVVKAGARIFIVFWILAQSYFNGIVVNILKLFPEKLLRPYGYT
jgi:hypothetical protein